ncbi:MAG: carboxymuconolactone decarboxylase family protein [Gammaproteobacteria bacterium]
MGCDHGRKISVITESARSIRCFLEVSRGSKALLEFHDIVLRGESPLTPSEREMIAAHVSGINACDYCYGSHSTIAGAFGVDSSVFDEMQNDLSTADVDDTSAL